MTMSTALLVVTMSPVLRLRIVNMVMPTAQKLCSNSDVVAGKNNRAMILQKINMLQFRSLNKPGNATRQLLGVLQRYVYYKHIAVSLRIVAFLFASC